MSIEFVASIATIVGAFGALAGLLWHGFGNLGRRIDGTRTELKAEIADTRRELRAQIDGTRTELRAEIASVDGHLAMVERRTYDLSTRLPPVPAGAAAG